eukprot:4286823-Prymnesium_polylepis.1
MAVDVTCGTPHLRTRPRAPRTRALSRWRGAARLATPRTLAPPSLARSPHLTSHARLARSPRLACSCAPTRGIATCGAS